MTAVTNFVEPFQVNFQWQVPVRPAGKGFLNQELELLQRSQPMTWVEKEALQVRASYWIQFLMGQKKHGLKAEF